MKRSILAVLLLNTIFIITGCGGGGGGSSSTSNYEKEKAEITQALNGFEAAVEAYNVDGMLAVFNESNTTETVLTIKEGSFSYSKSYNTLKEELEDDETDQLTWRKAPAETGGHGYALDMVLGNLDYSNMSTTGGYATQTFEIYESALDPAIAKTKTDSGTIIWGMAKNTGKWDVISMTISFNTTTVKSLLLTKSMQNSKNNGFGFGKGFTYL